MWHLLILVTWIECKILVKLIRNLLAALIFNVDFIHQRHSNIIIIIWTDFLENYIEKITITCYKIYITFGRDIIVFSYYINTNKECFLFRIYFEIHFRQTKDEFTFFRIQVRVDSRLIPLNWHPASILLTKYALKCLLYYRGLL